MGKVVYCVLSFFLIGSEANWVMFAFDVGIRVPVLLFSVLIYLLKGIILFASVSKLKLKPSFKSSMLLFYYQEQKEFLC